MSRERISALAAPDPERPGYFYRLCAGCGKKIRGTRPTGINARCSVCYSGRPATYNRKPAPRNAGEILALRVTELRLAIIDATYALEKGKPDVALARLQQVSAYDSTGGPLSSHEENTVYPQQRTAGRPAESNAQGLSPGHVQSE